jgi:anti-sigma B factor antagonist
MAINLGKDEMAQLIIAERTMDGVTVLDLTGDITFGHGTEKLRSEIRHLLAEGKSRIWLNLEDVCYVDSSGIGELISGLTAVSRREDGQLKLMNPPDRLIKLLEISNLLGIFDIYYEKKISAI